MPSDEAVAATTISKVRAAVAILMIILCTDALTFPHFFEQKKKRTPGGEHQLSTFLQKVLTLPVSGHFFTHEDKTYLSTSRRDETLPGLPGLGLPRRRQARAPEPGRRAPVTRCQRLGGDPSFSNNIADLGDFLRVIPKAHGQKNNKRKTSHSNRMSTKSRIVSTHQFHVQ